MRFNWCAYLAIVALWGCSRSDSTASDNPCEQDCEVADRLRGSMMNGGLTSVPDEVRDAVVSLSIDGKSCVGVHVGSGRVATAWHCVSGTGAGSGCRGRITASWGSGQGSCLSVTPAGDGRDLAYVSLSATPPGMVTIATEYSFSPQENVVCVARRRNNSVSVLPGIVANDASFRHTCSLDDGDSGSAIIVSDDSASASGFGEAPVAALSGLYKLVGIHTGARSGSNFGVKLR